MTKKKKKGIDVQPEIVRLVESAEDISRTAKELAAKRSMYEPTGAREFDDRMARQHCYAARALMIASRALAEAGDKSKAVALAKEAAEHKANFTSIIDRIALDERNRD